MTTTIGHALLTLPAVRPLGWTLIAFVWQGAAIAMLLFATLTLLRRASAQARYIAGCIALLLMALCPIVTYAILAERAAPVTVPRLSADLSAVTLLGDHVSVAESAGSAAIPFLHDPTNSVDRIVPWIVAVWLLGVAVLSSRSLGAWILVHRMTRRASIPVMGWLSDSVQQMALRMGIRRPIALRESGAIRVPSVLGCFKPVILVPIGFAAGMPADQVEALIAHEFAHILRHDYLINLVQTCIETLLFYHPAVWWVSRRIRAEREHGCDDLALAIVGDRRTYARALASMEQLRSVPPTVAATGGELLLRIRRIIGEPCMQPYRLSSLLAGATVLALLLSPLAMTRIHASPRPAPKRASEPPVVVSAQEPFGIQKDDVAELKARIAKLEEENRRLRELAKGDIADKGKLLKRYGLETRGDSTHLNEVRAKLEAARKPQIGRVEITTLLQPQVDGDKARDLKRRGDTVDTNREMQLGDTLAKRADEGELLRAQEIASAEQLKALADQKRATVLDRRAAESDLTREAKSKGLLDRARREEKLDAVSEDLLQRSEKLDALKSSLAGRERASRGKQALDIEAQIRELREQNRALQKQLEELRLQMRELQGRR